MATESHCNPIHLILVPERDGEALAVPAQPHCPVLAFRKPVPLRKPRRPGWPKTEKFPRSMAEALRLGWQVSGEGEVAISDDETIQTGVMEMCKDLGPKVLWLEIPFRARFAYGRPRNRITQRKADLEKAGISL
jgi:hypothetical protein